VLVLATASLLLMLKTSVTTKKWIISRSDFDIASRNLIKQWVSLRAYS
jgi:hypothetical protein